MTCTRAGCKNVQCYVCHKSCGYSHFDDASRGGKAGHCPLFENVHERHEKEVLQAEKRARQEAIEANPNIDIEKLKITVSEKVKQDEEQWKKRRQPVQPRQPFAQRFMPPAVQQG